MAQKKKTKPFPDYIIRDWEVSDGVNFAIALSRLTGWLLHVDWWTPTDDKEVAENMKSLRVYVGNNASQVYDFKGKQSLATFVKNIIQPISQKRGANYGSILTRFYSESQLFSLPMRVKPTENKINTAQKIIIDNKDFLGKIPKRQAPNIPAHIAADFSYRSCNLFATALNDLRDYKPVALMAKKYSDLFGGGELGYVHSFVFDNDGNAIDIWGKDTVENIAQRYGVVEYELSEPEHVNVNQKLKTNSPENYEKMYEKSVAIINEYFPAIK
ncbi:hypothetical protein [Spirosoma pollinicola]|uniref:Uncharacterized protein n=1 Tax=Spirosoma pollinicola TaxID=2057025 RepID=A0A2K8Z666_9BACT|nr:hypothetical protein [Spirosoma pollinicola]AUD05361.1 hypothetical protein CWM47_28010 [Spirosoma pollinicola]